MHTIPPSERTECQQCGTCCRKGGPALHREDIRIIRDGYIGYQHLITIRQGELAYDPARGGLVPSAQEFIKIKGRGGEWTCCFFEPDTSACTIYVHRPLECRLLKCWQPDELLSVIGRDTVNRRDLLANDDPALALLDLHERQCPAAEVQEAISLWQQSKKEQAALQRLTTLVRQDLMLRHQAVIAGRLADDMEFFLLGRPLFKLLAPLGITVIEVHGDIELQYRP